MPIVQSDWSDVVPVQIISPSPSNYTFAGIYEEDSLTGNISHDFDIGTPSVDRLVVVLTFIRDTSNTTTCTVGGTPLTFIMNGGTMGDGSATAYAGLVTSGSGAANVHIINTAGGFQPAGIAVWTIKSLISTTPKHQVIGGMNTGLSFNTLGGDVVLAMCNSTGPVNLGLTSTEGADNHANDTVYGIYSTADWKINTTHSPFVLGHSGDSHSVFALSFA
jgi:hypothetical protein